MAKILVPQQKTFNESTVEKLDEVVNKWLLERAKAKKPSPMNGHTYSAPYGGSTPDHCATYYFIDEIEIDDSIKGD